MASPKGIFIKRGGPLAGTYASYFRYQQARAQSMGFTSYSAEKRMIVDPVFKMLESRMMALGRSRNSARAELRQVNPKSISRHNVIAWAVENDLFDGGDDAAYELYGSQSE